MKHDWTWGLAVIGILILIILILALLFPANTAVFLNSL
jgi:hypothetical protein